jgi:hypothetical protein
MVDKLELARMRGEAVEAGKSAYEQAIRQFFGRVPNRQERRSPEGKKAVKAAEQIREQAARACFEAALQKCPIAPAPATSAAKSTVPELKRPSPEAIEAASAEFRGVSLEDSRNWTEDYPHENGNYQNLCYTCNRFFYGHKRRVICRDCTTAAASRATTLTGDTA